MEIDGKMGVHLDGSIDGGVSRLEVIEGPSGRRRRTKGERARIGVESLMPAELSGGMARRVALARTIALDPELMLYDEPFTGLDPISLGVIASLVRRVNKALRATSVMVTHDITQSLEIADQVIFLAHGEILFSGSPAEMRQLDSPWINQFIHGKADGPVAFRYPAATTLQQDLRL